MRRDLPVEYTKYFRFGLPKKQHPAYNNAKYFSGDIGYASVTGA
jgi:hypothetical protein